MLCLHDFDVILIQNFTKGYDNNIKIWYINIEILKIESDVYEKHIK